MVQVISQPTLWRAHGESVADVQAWLGSTRKTWHGNSVVTDHMDSSWTLGDSYKRVQELAREGWSEGAQNISDILANRLPARSKVNRWKHDMAGVLPDVPRHLSGLPDCMLTRGHDNARKPVIAMFVNVWIRCDVKAKHMANYGAAVVAAIDQIENKGKHVELTAGVVAPHSKNSQLIMSATWDVKRAQDPVDFGALAFSLAHPGASRRFGWDMWRRSDKRDDTGYGRGVGYIAKEEDLIDPVPGVLILTGLNSDPNRCATIEDAIAFVRNQINQAAGEELVSVEE